MKIHRLFSLLLISAILSTLAVSCKKGDGDPFFSISSRKARLTGEWKVVDINKKVTFRNTTIETKFDGNNKRVKTTVRDTIIDGKDSTLITESTYTGYINYGFKKDGTYTMLESFTDDNTTFTYTLNVDGLWYFLGANKESGYKNKEILALQDRTYVFNPADFISAYTTKYKGDNEMSILPIYQLKSTEIIFKVENTETINSRLINTTMEIKLQPK